MNSQPDEYYRGVCRIRYVGFDDMDEFSQNEILVNCKSWVRAITLMNNNVIAVDEKMSDNPKIRLLELMLTYLHKKTQEKGKDFKYSYISLDSASVSVSTLIGIIESMKSTIVSGVDVNDRHTSTELKLLNEFKLFLESEITK